MTPRDDPPPSSTAERGATAADVLPERATPQPTILSTVWEGPSEDGATEDESDQRPRELGVGGKITRSQPVRWFFAPATRSRALLITVAAAAICGGVLAVGELDRAPVSPSAPVQDFAAATQGSLSSRAIVTDDPDDKAVDDVAREAAPAAQESLSADERLRLVANPVESEMRTWMLEAQVDPADSTAVVQFTVNGAVVAEVDRAPYRLLLTPELLASLQKPVGEGQPMIVTASAIWRAEGESASPATVVLPN